MVLSAHISLFLICLWCSVYRKYLGFNNVWFRVIASGISVQLFGVDLSTYYIPHGMMIGAGMIGLLQFILVLLRSKKQNIKKILQDENHENTRNEKDIQMGFRLRYILYVIGVVVVAMQELSVICRFGK